MTKPPDPTSYAQWQASVAAVLKLIKQRFPNLTGEEAFALAADCVKAVLESHNA